MGDESGWRLYGTPGAEVMYTDVVSAYESQVEPCDDEVPGRAEIEEWSVHPPRHHMPTVGFLLDWLMEWTAENGEYGEDFGGDAIVKDKEVIAAAEAFLDAVASKVWYRMADQKLASHWVTWDGQGRPLLDGEPMYHPHITSVGI